jgi:hypothetical protein
MNKRLLRQTSWTLATALSLGAGAFLVGRLALSTRAVEAAPSGIVPAGDRAAKVTVGEHGELRVNGKPFLPLFVWLQPIENFEMLQALGINTFMAEGGGNASAAQFLDALKARGMWGIIHARQANYALKNHPALLTWMFGDEPDMAARAEQPAAAKDAKPEAPAPRPRVTPEEIAKQFAAIKAADPTHPSYLNLTSGFYSRIGGASRLGDETYKAYCRATDIVGYDLYPVTGWGRPEWVPHLYGATAKLHELAPANVPVWAILECTTKLRWVSQDRLNQLGRPHGATATELRSMVWMSLLAGAKGIGYFPHRWEPYKPAEISDELQAEMKRTNRQLTELTSVILGTDVAGKVNVENIEGDGVRFAVKQAEGGSVPHLFLVNAATTPARVRLRVTGAKSLRDLDSGQTTALKDGGTELAFEPLQVRLYAFGK